jgi:hypothetical protein
MANRRRAIEGLSAGLLLLSLAVSCPAATKALYDGTADDRQLGAWGNGKLAVSTDVKLDSIPALEVTARGLCEGGRYVLSPAQDLATFLRAPSTSFLVLKVRLGSAAPAMRMMGAPGVGGAGMPGMMQGGQGMMPGMMQGGQGMMPGMMQGGQGMMPGMMQGGQGMMPGMMQGGQGMMPGMMQGGQGMMPGMMPGMMQGGQGGQGATGRRQGRRGAGDQAAPAARPAPAAGGADDDAALPSDATSFFAQLPGLPAGGAPRAAAGLPQIPGEGPPAQVRGAGGAPGAAAPGMMQGGQGVMPGMMQGGQGMMQGGQGMMPGMMQGGQGMMPGMMQGGQGMMPGMMQGGQGARGGGAAGGGPGAFPSFGGMRTRGGGAPRTLSQIRVLLVTDKGQLDAGVFDIEGLKKTGDWSEIRVPFSKLRGKGGQTGAKLQAIVLTGNSDGKFYVGRIEVTSG